MAKQGERFILLNFFLAMATGQVCVNRFVRGRWKCFGDCEEKPDKVVAEIQEKTKNENELLKASKTPTSCSDVDLEFAKLEAGKGGIFDVNITDAGISEVYCDVTTDGGNWTVFQRRKDGSVDFNRLWSDYVDGFGVLNGEFWLGLERIHQMTKIGKHELRLDMIRTKGNYYYAQYSSFKVGPASDDYRLSVGGYSGNATDAIANPSHTRTYINGMLFSTRDHDNSSRANAGYCAVTNKGGWWFNNCFRSFLNGRYSDTRWLHDTSGWMFMKHTEMKFRQKQ